MNGTLSGNGLFVVTDANKYINFDEGGAELTGTVATGSYNGNTLATNVPGIFAGGDFVTGPDMVVEAIAAGRRGAIAIDKYLRKDTSRVEIYDRKNGGSGGEKAPQLDETWENMPRTRVKTLPLPERRASFTEIELGFSEEVARREAKRCLRCDLEG